MADVDDTSGEVLLLGVGDEVHAVALTSVREVLPAAPITPVPDAPAWLDGLVNLRGEVLPVIDTGRCLDTGDHEGATHLVVADTAGGATALLATSTPRRGCLGERVRSGHRPGALAQYIVGEGLCTLLDLDELTGQAQ